MAFDYTNLYPDTSANGGYTKSWNYTTVTDSIAVCSASGYFNKVATRLGIGDNIIIARVDAFDTKNRTALVEYAELFVNGISGGVVTTINYSASPALTGTPTAPTAAVDTNTTQIATTAMVIGQAAAATPLIDGTATVGTSTRFARADHVHPTDTTRAALSALRSYLAGLTLSTAGSSATFGVAAGVTMDGTNTSAMALASAYTKTTSAWAVGTAAGSLDTGAIANSTWYHVYLIQRTDTSVVDVLISLSATAPTMPTNYTLKRRIGSIKTNGSAQWTKFIQDGDTFQWDAAVVDVTAANPGAAAVTRTLSTPLGVRCEAVVNVNFLLAAGAITDNPAAILLSDLSISDQAPSVTGALTFENYYSATTLQSGAVARVFTNTSSQIRSRMAQSTANTTLYITTQAWVDRRGRDT